ncbi:MAG: AAA family ATPase [Sphingobium sp.]
MADNSDMLSPVAGRVAGWIESGAPFGGQAVRRVETHAAFIFLCGDRAWKLKKPVRFGYLDFSTVEKRREALAAELRLNRRTAPQLYLGLHRVTCGDEARAFSLDGDGQVVDWLLEMRRFPDDALLADRAGKGLIDDALMRDLADHVVALHDGAPVVRCSDGAARLRRVVEGNAASMAAFPALLEEGKARRLTERLLTLIDRHAALLDRRGRQGQVRHGHGDLHLGNIALVDGRPVAFDCLEFDAALATADVLYDLCFLMMDLCERGLIHAANLLFNRYFDLSPEQEGAVGLLPLFMAVRASIRAHVLAAQAGQGGQAGDDRAEIAHHARHYLDFALLLLEGAEDGTEGGATLRLIAIGGLSGTGKSTLARALGGEIGPPPGARILRSDILRKRLAGVAPEERLPPETYTQEASRKVYAGLDHLAKQALQAGWPVLADAVFAMAEEREGIAGIAKAQGARFDGLWLTLCEEERVTRIEARQGEARQGDASDADADVARMQTKWRHDQPENWAILKAGGDFSGLAARARRALEV